jgi:hypothetical protein
MTFRDLGRPPSYRSQSIFRVAVCTFAAILLLFAVWIVLPELLLPAAHGLPTDPEAAASAARGRAGAERAARIAIVRGDLWTQAAFSYAGLLWPHGANENAAAQNDARSTIEAALAYAPHDPGLWLLAAGLASSLDWHGIDAAAVLKMSYYTGLNETALLPLRLIVSLQSVDNDPDIKQFLERDVRMILSRWGELKPALIASYQASSPRGKQLLEAAVAASDPSFLQALRGPSRSP